MQAATTAAVTSAAAAAELAVEEVRLAMVAAEHLAVQAATGTATEEAGAATARSPLLLVATLGIVAACTVEPMGASRAAAAGAASMVESGASLVRAAGAA